MKVRKLQAKKFYNVDTRAFFGIGGDVFFFLFFPAVPKSCGKAWTGLERELIVDPENQDAPGLLGNWDIRSGMNYLVSNETKWNE